MPFSEYESISNDNISSEEFRAKYENDFKIDGCMISSTSEIIKTLARKMNKDPKAVHLLVKRKFSIPSAGNKAKRAITPPGNEKRENAPPKNEKKHLEISSDNSNSVELDNCAAQTNKLESFRETFEVEDKAIFEIVCTKTKHRNRYIDKQRVKSGWSHKLGRFLFEKTELSCKFTFQNIWIGKNGKIKATGHCDCKARANISFHLNILEMEINDISRNFPHTRVYQIRGERKDEFIQQLKHGSALSVRTKLINDLNPDNTNLNVNHNPFVSKLNTLRILKHKDHKRDADPIDVLSEWKDSIYRNVISAISLSPFYIFFQTALQLAWYLVECKKRSISISIDATGSLVIPPSRSQKIDGSDKLKHVFLYTIMAKTAAKSVAIAQMISQDQSSEFIIFFLKKVFKNLKLPVEIVCDESKALLKALSITFANRENIGSYIAACMSSLLNGTTRPDCYIRIDRSHFVKNIMKKIKCRDFRKRKLFRSIIGYLIKCDSFEIAKKIIHDFFTLILNEKDGYNCEGPMPAEAARKRLFALCSTHDEHFDYAEESDVLESETEDTDKNLDYDTDSTWINEIIEKVITKSPIDGNHDNLYYNPGDKEMYVKLFSSIALWSNVMNPIFGSTTTVATSSDVESHFKSLKTGILGRKMYRADGFLEVYVDFVNAEIKLNAISNNIGSAKRNRSNSLEEGPMISPGKLIRYFISNFVTH